MQLGVCLTVLLGLMFFSGGLFYLYTFNYDVGPYFTLTRFIHFYAGLASIPFLLAKYGSTGFRFAGYYLRLPRFKKAGAAGADPAHLLAAAGAGLLRPLLQRALHALPLLLHGDEHPAVRVQAGAGAPLGRRSSPCR